MWIITKDLIDDGNDVGVRSRDYEASKSDSAIHRFRMFDGDGRLYYEDQSSDCDSERGLAPLDDFGEGNAGCASIYYLCDDRWVEL